MIAAPHSLQKRAFVIGRAFVCYERNGADLSAPLPVTHNPQPGQILVTPLRPSGATALPADGLDSPSVAPTVLSATDSLSGACSHGARCNGRNHSPCAPLWPAMRKGGDAIKSLSGAQRRATGNGAASDTDRR